MNIHEAAEIIWDYHHMHHKLKKADAIFLLGHHDLRVPVYGAELYKKGYAPLIVCSGSGSIHRGHPHRNQFGDKTEAEVFRDILIREGVPKEAILIENRAQNTGENYQLSKVLLEEEGIELKTAIAVQKPYMERRTFATGKRWWPDVELIVSSPNIAMLDYPNEIISEQHMIEAIVGDFQRIVEYPKTGCQIEQAYTQDIVDAFNFLVGEGYIRRLIQE